MKFEDLDKLLECLDEKDIMQRYYGEPITEKKPIYRNITRNDCKGTCSFFRKGNRYYLYDFSSGGTVGCYDVVMYRYNCSYYQARLKVAEDFALINKSEDELKEIKQVKQYNIEQFKPSASYRYLTRPYNKEDVEYWSKFHVSISTLIYFNIQPLQELYTYRYTSNRYILSFDYKRLKEIAYVFELQGKNKFYRPTSKLRDYKWFGNTTGNCVYGLDKLSAYVGDTLIIASGPKDMAVLYEAGYNVIAPMSESTPLPEHVVEYVQSHFKRVYYLYDTDRAGLINGVKFSILHGFTPIWIPKEPKVKDVADYAEKHGLNKLYDLIESLINGHSKTNS